MKLRATIKIRQDFLIEKREELGMSQKNFSHAIGVSITTIQRAEKLDFSSAGDGFVASMQKVADFCCVDLEKIFPKELRGKRLETTKVAKADVPVQNLLSSNQALRLKSPEEIVTEENLKSQVRAVLRTIPEREAKIIRQQFGIDDGEEKFLKTIALKEKISRERVRQISLSALRSLRNPKRARMLKPFLENQ